MPSEDCCGWFSNLGSSFDAWDTRHCLLAGRSIGEGEVGWSILVIKMDWIRSYAQGSFVADKPRRGCCHFYQCFLA
ncbi:unnamed protein product [Penicillium nalgiovense]|nr:unnamed protein product [Penicillium nalgiovense]CAG8068623.1 unnamed protein product [Penicillium nalgiovense]CAG8256694.1 unnamed protein product [Penicillium nalgiovense]